MTRDETIRMARKAGFYVGTNMSGVELVGHQYLVGNVLVHLDVEDLQAFAVIIAAAEREACAKACAEVSGEYDWLTARRCAEAILERGNAND